MMMNIRSRQPGKHKFYPQADTTDRVNGEYHYKTDIPRRFIPMRTMSARMKAPFLRNTTLPRKARQGSQREPKAQSSGSGWVKIVCVALICALLGGFAGGAIMSGKYSSRMDQLESQIAELNKKEEQLVINTGSAPAV